MRAGRIPEARGLRVLQFDDDTGPKREVLAGVFARAGDRDSPDAAHPLNLVGGRLCEQTEAYQLPDLLERAPSRPAQDLVGYSATGEPLYHNPLGGALVEMRPTEPEDPAYLTARARALLAAPDG